MPVLSFCSADVPEVARGTVFSVVLWLLAQLAASEVANAKMAARVTPPAVEGIAGTTAPGAASNATPQKGQEVALTRTWRAHAGQGERGLRVMVMCVALLSGVREAVE